MNTFTLVQRALDATLDDPEKQGLDARDIEMGRVVGAVQTVVDALTPPDGGRYVVSFADISTAQTSLGERRIIVSSKPLRDNSLSLVEKAVVIATFAAHEIGHRVVTRPRADVVAKHNTHSGFHAVANLADDIILEPVMVDRFPILADAFTFTGEWVLRATAKQPLPKQHRLTKDMTTADRFNLLLSATRYGDISEIVWADAPTIAERDWSRDWAGRLCAADLLDHDTFLALCDEVWERIRTEPPVEDEPEPEPTDEGGDEDGEDEDEDGEGEPVEVEVEVQQGEDESQPGEDEGEDEGDGGSDEDTDGDDATDDEGDDTTDGEGDDESDDESDESDEDDGESGSSDEDEDGGESDDEDEGEGDDATDGDANDEPLDFDDDDESDEDGDESDGTDGSGESDEDIGEDSDAIGTDPADGTDTEEADGDDVPDDAEGGGGNNTADDSPVRDEDDFDKDEVDESMHDSAERDPYDWDGQRVEQAVRTYASTTVTAFGRHGSLSTTWE